MPELTEEQKAAQEAAAAKAATEADAAAKEKAGADAEDAGKADDDGKPNPYEGLPEEFSWMVKKIESTSREAASYRTRLRETEEKLAGATPEDLAKTVAEVRKENERLRLDNAKSTALAKHGLPEAAAALLDGASPEEIEAKAVALLAFRGEQTKSPLVARDGVLSGGRTAGGPTEQKSGADLMRAYLSGKR